MSDNALSVGEVLSWADCVLKNANINNPKLSSEVLLCDALCTDKTHLYLDRSLVPSTEELRAFKQNIMRRANQEPLQYITGKAGFMGKDFCVEPGVLIPRPETEVMVENSLYYLKSLPFASSHKTINILDLCTGSGCIAISIASELKQHGIQANTYATDISTTSLKVAKLNAERHNLGVNITFLQGDLFEPIEQEYHQLIGQFDLIVSNPPYVPSAVYGNLPSEVKNYEPKIALEAGTDGMKFFNKIADFAAEALRLGGMLAVELYETKLTTAAHHLKTLKYDNIETHIDLAGKPRFITASACK